MNNKTIELHTIATFQGKEYELENLLNGLLNKLEEKDKEIKRLKAREEECMNAYLRARQDVSEYEGKYVVAKYVIDELEKWLEKLKIDNQSNINNNHYKYNDWFESKLMDTTLYKMKPISIQAQETLDKLKELKEGK
jgi:hypothetical protein